MNQADHSAYAEVFQASLDAIVCSDETGLITLWNQAAEQMFGYSTTEAIGQPFSMLMSAADAKKHQIGLHHIISSGEARISGETIEVRAVRKDGTSFPVELSLSSGKTAHGWNFTAILRDVSKRNKLMNTLKANEDRFNMAQAVGHVGIWDWNPNTGELIWTDETYRIFGLSPGEISPSYEMFLDRVHADDRGRLEQVVEAALSQISHIILTAALSAKMAANAWQMLRVK